MNCAIVYGVVQNVTDNVKLLVDQYHEDNSLPMFTFIKIGLTGVLCLSIGPGLMEKLLSGTFPVGGHREERAWQITLGLLKLSPRSQVLTSAHMSLAKAN